jgi:hypothetical protein
VDTAQEHKASPRTWAGIGQTAANLLLVQLGHGHELATVVEVNMRNTIRVAAVAFAVPLAIGATASMAAEFSPSLKFSLKPAKVKKNSALRIKVSQDTGEQELGHVTLKVPAGFKLPLDGAIDNGDQLGVADLAIDVGGRCAGAGPFSAPAMFPDRPIIEQDRTDEQSDRGVKAVWVVDLRPVTTIPLEVTGSARRGWKLDGDIPANQFTCPPLKFDGVIFKKSADGRVAITKNPAKPGTYVFKGTLHSQDSPTTKTIKTPIRIKR